MSVLDVVQVYRSSQGLNMYVGVGNVANVVGGSRTFQADISMQFLGAQGAGAGMQGDAGISRNQDFIIDPAGLGVGARQQVRLDIHAVSVLDIVDFNFVRVQNRVDHDRVGYGGLNRNRAVRIRDRDAGLRSNSKVILFPPFTPLFLGRERAGYNYADGNDLCRASTHHIRTPPKLIDAVAPQAHSKSFTIMAENDPSPSQKAWIFADTHP